MMRGLVRSFSSFGATNFEKARVIGTYSGDTEAPDESDLQIILHTLSGKDKDTDIRPQIAFTTILQKLESSKSKLKWNYLVKNLIILDRCVDERFFVQDIANLKISHVEQYSETDLAFQNLSLDQFIRLYFRYIKFKAFVYSKKNTSFNMSREEVKSYFMSQQPEQIFAEFSMTQKMQEIIMEVGRTDKKGHLKFKVNQYVFLLLLFTLTNLFATQYMATLALVEKLFSMQKEQAETFKSLYARFLKQNEELVIFINTHKFIKGYGDININDFSKCDTRIIAAIDDYLLYQLNQQQVFGLPEETIFDDDQQLVFENFKNIRSSVAGFNDDDKTVRSRPHVKKFDIKVQEEKSQRLMETDFKEYDESVYQSFQHNFSTEYQRLDVQFFKKSEQIQSQKIFDKYDDSSMGTSCGNQVEVKSVGFPTLFHTSSTPGNYSISNSPEQSRSQSIQQGQLMSQSLTIQSTLNNPNRLTDSDFDVQLLDEDAFMDQVEDK